MSSDMFSLFHSLFNLGGNKHIVAINSILNDSHDNSKETLSMLETYCEKHNLPLKIKPKVFINIEIEGVETFPLLSRLTAPIDEANYYEEKYKNQVENNSKSLELEIQNLEKIKQKAIASEDYEKCTEIRDKISQLKEKLEKNK